MTLPSTTAVLTNPQTLTASGASAAFPIGAISPGVGSIVVVDVTAVSGTNAECDFRLQYSPDGGTTWTEPGGSASLIAAVTGVGTFAKKIEPTPGFNKFRLTWTVTGSTPSFTVSAISFP